MTELMPELSRSMKRMEPLVGALFQAPQMEPQICDVAARQLPKGLERIAGIAGVTQIQADSYRC